MSINYYCLSAIKVIKQSCLSLCACGFVEPILCTISMVQGYVVHHDLSCAPPTCVVHHGVQGRAMSGHRVYIAFWWFTTYIQIDNEVLS